MVKGVSRSQGVSQSQQKKAKFDTQRGAIKSAAMTEFVAGRTPRMSASEGTLHRRKVSFGSKNPTDKKVHTLGLNFLLGKKKKH